MILILRCLVGRAPGHVRKPTVLKPGQHKSVLRAACLNTT